MATDNRPNLLFLAHRAPFPPDRGDRIRSYHILKHLSQRYRVYLGALLDEPISEESLRTLRTLTADLELVPLSRCGRWTRAAWSLAKGRSATAGLFESPRLKSRISAWAKSVEFDAVFAFCSSMVQYSELPELENVPLIVDLVDVDSQKWFDYSATARSWKRPLFALEARRVRQLERSLPARAKAILLVSEAEAGIYRSFCPNDKTHAVMNGVDLAYFRSDFPVAQPRPNQCVFVGVLDYRANVESLVWFCQAVWPHVLAGKPDATFAIVGKNPNGRVRALGDLPGVRLIGPVADVRPFIAESRFVVAPLLVARGIQNKVLEAMAMAKPVIATPQALEGLSINDAEEALEAGSSTVWSTTMARLYADADLCHGLGIAARRYVQTRHGWDACLAPLSTSLMPVPTGAIAMPPPDIANLVAAAH